MAQIATHLAGVLPLAITPEYLLFGGAGVISLLAFTGLILAPALGSYGRAWEKAAAAFISLFVLGALVLVGVAIGVAVVYYWEDITGLFGG
jgi:hypothetical protein